MDGYHGYVESGASSVNAAVKSELYTYILYKCIYPSINQRVSRPTVFLRCTWVLAWFCLWVHLLLFFDILQVRHFRYGKWVNCGSQRKTDCPLRGVGRVTWSIFIAHQYTDARY